MVGTDVRDNTTDFQELKFRQRIAVNMEGRSTSSTMIGEAVTMPVALAPVGLTGMQCADGEIKAARAAGKFGVPFTLSTMSICSIEDVAEATDHPFWFQVYTLKDDDFMRRLMERAKAAQCSALVITVDLQMLGQRHKDLKNGLSAPPKLTLKSIADMMTKVSWGLEMLGTKRRFFGNIVGHAKGVSDASSLSSWTAEAFDQTLDWKRIGQLMEMWDGKVILKGILDVDDAKMAADLGADAIVVSNHGETARRRIKLHSDAIPHCGFSGSQNRGIVRQWHSVRTGCSQSDCAWCEGHNDRSSLYLWTWCERRSRRH